MADNPHTTAIVVAVCSLIGALGSAVIYNWEKIARPEQVAREQAARDQAARDLSARDQAARDQAARAEVDRKATEKWRDPKEEARRLAEQWLAAFVSGNVDELVALSGEPFYLYREFVLSKSALRNATTGLLNHVKALRASVQSIDVKTVDEMQREGFDFKNKRFFKNLLKDLNLRPDDLVATASVTTEQRTDKESMFVVVQRRGASYEIIAAGD